MLLGGYDSSVSVVDSWNGWESGISVVDGWESSVSVVDGWNGMVDGLGLGVGVGGWGVGVFHDGCSLDFDVLDDWLSGDDNFIWDWDSDWFLDIDIVRVDGDLSRVVVNSVKECGGDSDTWSEDLWFVDDGGVSGNLVLYAVVDCTFNGSCKVWNGLSYVLLNGGVVTLDWYTGLHGVVLYLWCYCHMVVCSWYGVVVWSWCNVVGHGTIITSGSSYCAGHEGG